MSERPVAGRHARLSLRRTGGLAGLAMEGTVDTRDLPQPRAQEVLNSLDSVDLEHDTTAEPAPGAADAFQYELTVQRGDTTHVATFSEQQVPPQLTGVIRTLMENAAPAPRRRSD
jgi:hypothetical protein